jgi:hydrophobic/amphiphilic exporter-1 (mainly G- bacteria), HAE1 family
LWDCISLINDATVTLINGLGGLKAIAISHPHFYTMERARLRFRPILMTSFAFILGVFPLVIATGAGAGARRSIGLAVFSGMIASTCLVVVFVPSFYVVMQRIQERSTRRVARNDAPAPPHPNPV